VLAVKKDIGIGVANAAGKAVNELGFGEFYEHCGICVKPFPGNKPSKTTYIMRKNPVEEGTGYRAGSKPKKIKASSELKPTKYRIKDTKAKKGKEAAAVIKVRANTYVITGDKPILHTAKTTIDVTHTGDVTLWQGATAKKPATMKQVIAR
jgi:hypothetical protein